MDIKEKILNEMNINLAVNEEIGEITIFFASIIISKKNDNIMPVFTTIVSDDLQEKNVDYARFNKAKQEFADAIIEIIRRDNS